MAGSTPPSPLEFGRVACEALNLPRRCPQRSRKHRSQIERCESGTASVRSALMPSCASHKPRARTTTGCPSLRTAPPRARLPTPRWSRKHLPPCCASCVVEALGLHGGGDLLWSNLAESLRASFANKKL